MTLGLFNFCDTGGLTVRTQYQAMGYPIKRHSSSDLSECAELILTNLDVSE